MWTQKPFTKASSPSKSLNQAYSSAVAHPDSSVGAEVPVDVSKRRDLDVSLSEGASSTSAATTRSTILLLPRSMNGEGGDDDVDGGARC